MTGSDDTAMHEVEQEARYEEFRRRRERREQLEARFKELVRKQERQKNVSLVFAAGGDSLPPELSDLADELDDTAREIGEILSDINDT